MLNQGPDVPETHSSTWDTYPNWRIRNTDITSELISYSYIILSNSVIETTLQQYVKTTFYVTRPWPPLRQQGLGWDFGALSGLGWVDLGRTCIFGQQSGSGPTNWPSLFQKMWLHSRGSQLTSFGYVIHRVAQLTSFGWKTWRLSQGAPTDVICLPQKGVVAYFLLTNIKSEYWLWQILAMVCRKNGTKLNRLKYIAIPSDQ